MALGIDPKVDIAFKKVFGSEENAALLIDLLQAVIQPVRAITKLELAPLQSEKEAPRDKQAIADIRVRDQGNRQFHIEMQWEVPWFFPKRILFYWGKFHPQQLREGENYQTLRPTIAVCFTNEVVFPSVADHHLVFQLMDTKHGLVFSNDLEVHLIELPKFTKTAEEVSDALDRWCFFLRHGAQLSLDQLPASVDVPMIRRAMEVLTVFTLEERERYAYEMHLKAERDHNSLMQEVREAREAKEQAKQAQEEAKAAKEQVRVVQEEAKAAKEQARIAQEQAKKVEEQAKHAEEQSKKAEERGALEGQIRLCQRMLKQAPSSGPELAALSLEGLNALLAQLLARVLPNGG